MNRKLIRRLGITGVAALLSYTAAVLFAPLAWPGYNWMVQAVSDLSAESAPSRILWNQLAAPYGICTVVCVTLVSVFVSEEKIGSGLFRLGIHLFTVMNWVSAIGYSMFPLQDAGNEITSVQESLHIAVTVLVVVLSILSLVILFIAGIRGRKTRGVGIFAGTAFLMMLAGAIGTGALPKEYFGIAERFSVFAASGFTAVLGMYLYFGFKPRQDGGKVLERADNNSEGSASEKSV